jgi:hypothetical protein
MAAPAVHEASTEPGADLRKARSRFLHPSSCGSKRSNERPEEAPHVDDLVVWADVALDYAVCDLLGLRLELTPHLDRERSPAHGRRAGS